MRTSNVDAPRLQRYTLKEESQEKINGKESARILRSCCAQSTSTHAAISAHVLEQYLGVANVDLHWVVQEGGRQLLDFLGPGGREKQGGAHARWGAVA